MSEACTFLASIYLLIFEVKYQIFGECVTWKSKTQFRYTVGEYRPVINQYRDTERNSSAFIIYICHTPAHKYPAACHYFLFQPMMQDQANKRVQLRD